MYSPLGLMSRWWLSRFLSFSLSISPSRKWISLVHIISHMNYWVLIFRDEFNDLIISLLYLRNPVWKSGQKWLQGQKYSFLKFFKFNFYFILKYSWFFFIFFLIMVLHRILTMAPMLCGRTLSSVHSACDRLPLVTVNSWFYALQGRPPGGGHGHSLQCSCLENPMDRGVQWVTRLHRVSHASP